MADPVLRDLYWCRACHKAIRIPAVVKKMSITGTLNIRCGTRGCRGRVQLTFQAPAFDMTAALVEHVMQEAAHG